MVLVSVGGKFRAVAEMDARQSACSARMASGRKQVRLRRGCLSAISVGGGRALRPMSASHIVAKALHSVSATHRCCPLRRNRLPPKAPAKLTGEAYGPGLPAKPAI